MSNPLLQPSDQFKPRSVVDPQGQNRFAEESSAVEEVRADASNPLAAPVDASAPAYQPYYQTSYPHRGTFVAWLGLLGFILCWCLLLVFVDQVMMGVAAALLGIALSLAAVVLGYQELAGMSSGAVDRSGRGSAQLGYRLGLGGVLLGIAALLWVFALIMQGVFEF